jgi:hypothetical protein
MPQNNVLRGAVGGWVVLRGAVGSWVVLRGAVGSWVALNRFLFCASRGQWRIMGAEK